MNSKNKIGKNLEEIQKKKSDINLPDNVSIRIFN